ncbi:DUF3515 family protein [Streptomyces sp. H51]|uniref:DUF3515 family protein n=1 Tax=Streptomyces sp. H51 TaxID=3111770 RepID=UPI002D797B1B|nr:DUF3515 family protein [Streptomyces sp. H51]
MLLRRRLRRVAPAVVALTGAGLATGAVFAVLAVTAGQPAVPGAAARGDAPECARIAGDYPAVLDGRRLSGTSRPGVAVWGDGAVTLRCGLRPPPATVDPCIDVDGVDWVWDQSASREGRRVLVTYGRDPAVEISVAGRVTGVDAVLVELSRTVRPIRRRAECVGDGDVL